MSNDLTVKKPTAGLVTSFDALERMAKMLAGGNPGKAIEAAQKIMYGLDLGIGLSAALSSVHIIEGKPVVGSGVLAGAIKGSGKYNYKVIESSSKVCILDFLEGKDEIGRIEVRIEDFQQYANKTTWKNHPDDMLFSRAVSKGYRRFCPDVFGFTVYVEGEIEAESVKRVEPVKNDEHQNSELLAVKAEWNDVYKALSKQQRADVLKVADSEYGITKQNPAKNAVDYLNLIDLARAALANGEIILEPAVEQVEISAE